MSDRSRLSRRLENQSKRNIIASLAGIGIIMLALVFFGVPLLATVSGFLISINNPASDQKQEKKNEFVAAPTLNSTFDATSSARVTISGYGGEKQTIQLYVNGEEHEETKTDTDGKFEFDGIKLKKGENTIAAKAKTENKSESDYSNELTIIYTSEPPKLTLDSPAEGQTFSKEDNTATVTGTTDAGVKVTVNGLWAIVEHDGKYSYRLPLKSGENVISVEAEDEAGNKTKLERKITYNP